MPRETQVQRADPIRDQTYRVTSSPVAGMNVEDQARSLSENVNRVIQDLAIRLTRIEARLDALEKK